MGVWIKVFLSPLSILDRKFYGDDTTERQGMAVLFALVRRRGGSVGGWSGGGGKDETNSLRSVVEDLIIIIV